MPRLRAARTTRLALIAAAMMLIAGCGQTVTVGGSRTFAVVVSEYRLVPQSVRTSAGVLTIAVHNEGRLAHNLAITEAGKPVAETKPILPGEVAYLPLDLAPGSYRMASTLFSDQPLGAYGTLTVTS